MSKRAEEGETQASILAWARETFGHNEPKIIASRCALEVAELLHRIVYGAPPEKIIDECADVAVMISQVAELREIDAALEAAMMGPTTMPDPIILAGEVTAKFGTIFQLLRWPNTTPRERTIYGELWKCLEGIVELVGGPTLTLVEARDNKMKVNRGRKWHTAADGRSQHVE